MVLKMLTRQLFMMTVTATVILARPQPDNKEEERKGNVNRKEIREEPEYPEKNIESVYDFIVIGSGPGGSTVASRLSEVSSWNVLLCEAGEVESPILRVPGFFPVGLATKYNWKFTAERQETACLGFKDERCAFPRGKGLGGSSLINAMIYTRGVKQDYDEWADLGNKGWSGDEVFPYFLKSEDMQILELVGSPVHRQGGYVTIERVNYNSTYGNLFLQASEELGYPVTDYNDFQITNVSSRMQLVTRKSLRLSAARAFLKPARYRRNLNISPNTRVTKILIDKNTKTAYGVELIKNGVQKTVKARKEVILSAGALQSPQLLMLSGVGPKDHLEELGISVIQDLPVGYNLIDHIGYPGLLCVPKDKKPVENTLGTPPVNGLAEFIDNRTGILATPGGLEILLFADTINEGQKYKKPEIEITFETIPFTAEAASNIKEDLYNTRYRPYDGQEVFSLVPYILHPKSTGRVKLKDTNYETDPIFYANYFEKEEDFQVLLQGIRISEAICKTQVYKNAGVIDNTLPFVGCENYTYASDEYYRCATRQLLFSISHQAGTCKMGPSTDPSAVVDPQLKVHGIKQLRVIDASIFPIHMSGHPLAPTYMIGEKGSDMVKKCWCGKQKNECKTTTGSGSFMNIGGIF